MCVKLGGLVSTSPFRVSRAMRISGNKKGGSGHPTKATPGFMPRWVLRDSSQPGLG